ncbi:MAG TPA: hypothetical protein VGD58_24000 [Herpetosiphonaceae bacterium]
MQIDPQINAERQAATKNWKLEQKYPLLHHAGIFEQVAERWTAERHLALQAACREALAASMSAAQAQAFASTDLYMEVCAELTDEEQMRAWTLRCNTASIPKRPHSIADFWYQRLKDALGLAQPCRCGGIWVCGLLQPRRRGETTHILDWYCADCKRSTKQQ